MRAHIVYESRLELTRLLHADFGQDVTAIFDRPFLLIHHSGWAPAASFPDFLAPREKDAPQVGDVKPRHLLTRPKVNFAFSSALKVVLAHAWDFEVRCEPLEADLANLRFP